MPPLLKHYFACDHRMNRQPFIFILLGFFVISMLFSGFVTSQMFANPNINLMELAQQKAQGTITDEMYMSKIQELQNGVSPWMSVIGLLFSLAFVPALMMRLKDINLSPKIALFVPAFSIIVLLVRLSGTVIIPYGLTAIAGAVIFIGEILLVFIPGTKGPNRYGADPVKR